MDPLEDARAEMCQGRDADNVKISSNPHTEMEKVCSHVLLKSMFLLKEKLVWEAYTVLHQSKARVTTIKRMFNLPQTHKSQNWILVLPRYFFNTMTAKYHSLFLCLRFLSCKMEKYINNNNINIKNNNGNVVLVCKALWDPWLEGTTGVSSIIMWPRGLFKALVPEGQESLASFLLKMSCKYLN